MNHLKRIGIGLALLGTLAAIFGFVFLLFVYPVYTVPFFLLIVAYFIGWMSQQEGK